LLWENWDIVLILLRQNRKGGVFPIPTEAVGPTIVVGQDNRKKDNAGPQFD
jgi:hypothetical protein